MAEQYKDFDFKTVGKQGSINGSDNNNNTNKDNETKDTPTSVEASK